MEFYQAEETNKLRRVINWMVDVVVVISLAWFAVYGFGSRVNMAGQSMVPILQSDDVVLMNRLAYNFRSPKRFDVVVFERDDKKSNVKRVIGLPGEVIQIKGGFIYINDQIMETEGNLNRVSLAGLAENPIQLEDGEYFLLGDNRDGSEDSRFANVGNVNKKQILGKVWLRLFPLIDLD
ncbi:MAG: signal peptidase I, partial [Hungatella sp.]